MQVAVEPQERAVDGFREMYEAALPVVYGFLLLRAGGNRSLAEDLTAETFAAAVVRYKAGRSQDVTLSWLRTVARRRLIDHWRRSTVANDNVINLVAPEGNDEADNEVRSMVMTALRALNEPQRLALVLQHIEGYSVVEIAGLLERTPKGTESLLARARVAFRRAFQELENV